MVAICFNSFLFLELQARGGTMVGGETHGAMIGARWHSMPSPWKRSYVDTWEVMIWWYFNMICMKGVKQSFQKNSHLRYHRNSFDIRLHRLFVQNRDPIRFTRLITCPFHRHDLCPKRNKPILNMSNTGFDRFIQSFWWVSPVRKASGFGCFPQAKGRGWKARHDVKHRDMQVCFYEMSWTFWIQTYLWCHEISRKYHETLMKSLWCIDLLYSFAMYIVHVQHMARCCTFRFESPRASPSRASPSASRLEMARVSPLEMGSQVSRLVRAPGSWGFEFISIWFSFFSVEKTGEQEICIRIDLPSSVSGLNSKQTWASLWDENDRRWHYKH